MKECDLTEKEKREKKKNLTPWGVCVKADVVWVESDSRSP